MDSIKLAEMAVIAKKKEKEEEKSRKKSEAIEEKMKKNPVNIIQNSFDFIKCFDKQYIACKKVFSDIFDGQDIPFIEYQNRKWYNMENDTTLSCISNLIWNISGQLNPKYTKDALDMNRSKSKILKFENILNAESLVVSDVSVVDFVVDSLFQPKEEEREWVYEKVKYFLRFAYQFWTGQVSMIDVSLIIGGRQGIGKSLFAKYLAGMLDPIVSKLNLFTDGDLDFESDKKLGETLNGKLVAELGELKSLMRSNAEDMKRNISKEYDSYRRAYGAYCVDQKRTAVFVGTTNYFHNILKDPTGNRRWIIVKSNRKINQSCAEDLLSANWFSFWKEVSEMPLITADERSSFQDKINEENESYVCMSVSKENLIDFIEDMIDTKSYNCYCNNYYKIDNKVKSDMFMYWSDEMKKIKIPVERRRDFDPFIFEILTKMGFEEKKHGREMYFTKT